MLKRLLTFFAVVASGLGISASATAAGAVASTRA
jgi:hypothetical protein